MIKRAVGFVGLGKMGGHMARRILSAGHDLTIFDTTEAAAAPLVAAGARAATSPRALADRAEIVFASLPMPDIVRMVALGPDGLCGGGRR